MNARSTCHATFTVERVVPAAPQRVFNAFADVDAKAAWFAGPGGWTQEIREMDFREGGRERVRGVWESGESTDFRAIYHDIVPGERIVYSYEMHHGEVRISVSLATVLFTPEGAGTRVAVTEQGVYVDHDPEGRMGPASREEGIAFQLDTIMGLFGGK
jgi:uncharacterized protein YndB with AHSA1/START domain